jgi:hypothetical protein
VERGDKQKQSVEATADFFTLPASSREPIPPISIQTTALPLVKLCLLYSIAFGFKQPFQKSVGKSGTNHFLGPWGILVEENETLCLIVKIKYKVQTQPYFFFCMWEPVSCAVFTALAGRPAAHAQSARRRAFSRPYLGPVERSSKRTQWYRIQCFAVSTNRVG